MIRDDSLRLHGEYSYENYLNDEIYEEMTTYFLRNLAPFGRLTVVRKGDLITGTHQGDVAVVVNGCFLQEIISLDGRRVPLFRLRRGMVVGEQEYFMKQPTTQVTEALEKSTLALLTPTMFQMRLQEDPGLHPYLLQSVIRKLNLMTLNQAEAFLNESTGRLASFLFRTAYITDTQLDGNLNINKKPRPPISIGRYTQEEIANRLGVNRVTVARGLKELKDAQLIQIQDGEIYVLDMDSLRKRFVQLGIESTHYRK